MNYFIFLIDIDKIKNLCNLLIIKSTQNLTYFNTYQLNKVLELIEDQNNIYYYKKYNIIKYILNIIKNTK